MKRLTALTLFFTLTLLIACSRGGSSGGQVTPASISMDFVQAVVQGDMARAETFLVGGADEELKGKVQHAIDVLSRYDLEDIEVASNREWRVGATDRRVEIRFKFRPQGSPDVPVKIGLITTRAVASGGLYSVGDVVLDRPTE